MSRKTYKDINGEWLYPEEIKKISSNKAVKKTDNSDVKIGPSELCLSQKNIQLILKQ